MVAATHGLDTVYANPASNKASTAISRAGRQGSYFDGVEYDLTNRPGGIFMCRKTCDERGVKVQTSIVFHNRDDFESWCNSDAVVRENPLLQVELKRHADNFFASV